MTRWATNSSVSAPAAVLAPVAGRILVGSTAALVAIAAEAVLFGTVFGGGRGSIAGFIGTAALVTAWVLVVLVPWSVFVRLAFGRTAAPWAVLALGVVAAWLGAGGGPPALLWVVPALPTDPSASWVFLPSSWGYALAHAACVTLAAAALVKRVP